MTARDSIAQWACLVCLGAFAVIGTLFWTETRKAWQEPIGYNGRLASPLAVPTLDPAPRAMYIVTMTPQTTETPAPTAKPWQTSTSVPDCIATEAIPGLPCIKHAPTKTPSVATVVPSCNVPPATIETGQLCIWPR